MGDSVDIEAEVKEAKGSFDLKAKLAGRQLRTDSVTLFTDEVTGAKHTEVERKLQNLSDHSANLERLGNVAEGVGLTDAAMYLHKSAKDALSESDLDEFAALEEERDELVAELRKTSLTFNLRAVPELIVKKARREARKVYKIEGDVPAEVLEDYTAYFTAFILSAMTLNYVDHESGQTITKLSVKDAQALADFLPSSQYAKLDAVVDQLQFKQTISDSVTDQADFSPSI